MNTILSTTFVLAESEAGMTRLFDLDWQLLHDAFLMIIAIFALFLFLSHFLFNPVRKFLSDRQSRIADDIETAQTEKADAIALKEDYENRIRGVILNGCTAMSYPTLARAIEERFSVRACGFLPSKIRKKGSIHSSKISSEMK